MPLNTQDKITPNLKLISSMEQIETVEDAESRYECEQLITSSLEDFIKGDMSAANAALMTLTIYIISWPTECHKLQTRLRACRQALSYWQHGASLEELESLILISRQLTDDTENTDLLYFVFDTIAHGLLQRRMYSEMREQLAWARHWQDTVENRTFRLAYELILAIHQSGAAGASEDLVFHVTAAMNKSCSLKSFESWFPVYLSNIAAAEYNLAAGHIAFARQHSAFANVLAIQADAPYLQVRALGLEAEILCEIKKPMAMYTARVEMRTISERLGLEALKPLPSGRIEGQPQSKVTHLNELINQVIAGERQSKSGDEHQALSGRERGILKLVQKGESNKEIARALNLSEDTIKYHLKNVFSKLGVSKRMHAVKIAQKMGYISTIQM